MRTFARVVPCAGFFFLTMADDKRINCVKVCFDDATFIALGRMAAREDRKVTELVHLIVRKHLYGHYARSPEGDEGPERDNDAL